ncbi:AAA family ATPase [Myxococcota bacterium]|nr:AAA family ATPase [Myxococcota bacterium]
MARSKKSADPTTDAVGDDVHLLVAVLPGEVQREVRRLPLESLTEVVMDLGRIPEARLPDRVEALGESPVTAEQLGHVLAQIGDFTEDNRAGIERTLHRISAIRNRKGRVVGLTLRVGRAIFGTIDLVRDLVETGQNTLILGRPGIGKTTKLREAARVLADDLGKRVIVIDTSNEIAGDGDIPHPGIGRARRMQVPRPERQHAVMIEAVENHMPEVVIVDEIGTEEEATAARTIAERGVQLIGTAHGNTLENLVLNPTLSDLVGGVHTVTLSDEEARRRGTPKTTSERRAPPTFDVVVEMADRDEVLVHRDTAVAVDRVLAGIEPGGERRIRTPEGTLEREERPPTRRPGAAPAPLPALAPEPEGGIVRIYPYAVSPDSLDRAIRDVRVKARIVARPEQADMIVALRSRAADLRFERIARSTGAPVHLVKNDTTAQLRRLLQNAFLAMAELDSEDVKEAVREAEGAVQRVLSEGVEVPLTPRRPAVRRIQHRLIARYHLAAESVGREPARYLLVHPAAEGEGRGVGGEAGAEEEA